MREFDDVRKREEKEIFVKKKKEVEELWKMWRDEGDEENDEEKETVGYHWRGRNTPNG